MHSIGYYYGPVRTYQPGDPDYPGIPTRPKINPFQYRPVPLSHGIRRTAAPARKPIVLSRQSRINSLGNKRLATDILTVLGYQELSTVKIYQQVGRPKTIEWFRDFMKQMEKADLIEVCGKVGQTYVWRATIDEV